MQETECRCALAATATDREPLLVEKKENVPSNKTASISTNKIRSNLVLLILRTFNCDVVHTHVFLPPPAYCTVQFSEFHVHGLQAAHTH